MRTAEEIARYISDYAIDGNINDLADEIRKAREEMRQACLEAAWSPIGYEAGAFSINELSQTKVTERIRTIENK